MKKVIIAFDGQHFPEGALRMAAWLNQQQDLLLTGVFLSSVDYREVIGFSGASMGMPIIPPPPAEAEDIGPSIARFKEFCRTQGMEFSVHRDTDLFALQQLTQETRFADLLILSSELFYENIDKDQPNEYLRRTLHLAECPVLLVPERFEEPGNLVLSYDGKASSVYALKQFAYLFPEICSLETLLVTAEDENKDVPQMDLITELAGRHYPNLTVETLVGETRSSFGRWMDGKPRALLVAGAFGRGEISNIFRHSFITDVIRAHRVPIFVAHV